ncbi:flagellar hook-length control protein FliK [Rhizobium skierniewicense]|uniref:flagellar hook-length control protein FliK n=1 Tax=Rhizobium TaxID=379 RepID=UPI001FAE1611|nr:MULTISPECIES: flagellar hook-length control protein FliK [Rhizobium]MCI9866462.1 flagellar hook-length control protein FliK [Rhizobium skierniewicense]
MNVAQAVIPGMADSVSQSNRQNKESASKRGGTGFSDTLGSFEKSKSPPQSSSPAHQRTPSADTSSASVNEAPVQPVVSEAAPSPVAAPISGTQAQVSNANPVAPAPIVIEQPVLPVQQDLSLETALAATEAGKQPDVTNVIKPLNDVNVAALPDNDLAALVTALTNLVTSPLSAKTDEAGDNGEDAGEGEVEAEPVEGAGDNMDLLSLLSSTTMPINQNTPPEAQNAMAQQAQQGGITGTAATDPGLSDSAATTSTVVRLQKQDTPGVDFHIETSEDGTATLDVSKASGDVTNIVQVVESRRFVGMAAASNATAISSAMAADPDWAASMAGQTGNAPMISSTGQVVHVLKIQMSPVELGHVTAAMKLVGDELSVQLTAHTLKGYSELQKDSSEIMDALKAQGFSVDQVTVTLASNADRQDSATGNRQPNDASQNGAQQGQRGDGDKSQEQFYRQPGQSGREETTINESILQPETAVGGVGTRPDHVYL